MLGLLLCLGISSTFRGEQPVEMNCRFVNIMNTDTSMELNGISVTLLRNHAYKAGPNTLSPSHL
jgi:hypothetical protein